MPLPLLVGAGLSLAGGLYNQFSNKGGSRYGAGDKLNAFISDIDQSEYIPWEDYNRSFQATSEQMSGQLGLAREQYNAEGAARGVFTGGESLKHYYSDVVLPLRRDIAAERERSELAYSQGKIQFEYRKDQAKLQAINQLLQLELSAEDRKSNLTSSLFGLSGQLLGTYYGQKDFG